MNVAARAYGTVSRWFARWVAFWDEREHPFSLALARILLGACITYDFFHLWRLDLVVPLFGVGEIGGFSDALMRDNPTTWYTWMPGTELGARTLHAVIALSALSMTAGFFTRTSAIVLLVTWGMFAEVLPYADRGIDVLSRLALTVFAFSSAGRYMGVDAVIRTGSFWGDGSTILAAPRRLLVLQLVYMYFGAGIAKIGVTWWPMGHFAALYFALQDPAVAAWDFSYLRHQPFFFFTQVGTAGTIFEQWTYPVVLLLMWAGRHDPASWPGVGWWGRAGKILAFAVRWRLERVWIVIGLTFHLILALTMNLGIFPWAMLALYPVWFPPHELMAFFRNIADRLRGRVAAPQT